MGKLKSIIKEVLFEQEREKSLKVIYKTDILLNEKKEEGAERSTFKSKTSGTVAVENDIAKTILTLEDLLAYLNKQFEGTNKVLNDFVVEIILSLSAGGENLENLITKEDKVIITIDYGFSLEDSVGIQVNKNTGVDIASLVMRKDGAPFGTGKFDPQIFEQIINNVFIKEL